MRCTRNSHTTNTLTSNQNQQVKSYFFIIVITCILDGLTYSKTNTTDTHNSMIIIKTSYLLCKTVTKRNNITSTHLQAAANEQQISVCSPFSESPLYPHPPTTYMRDSLCWCCWAHARSVTQKCVRRNHSALFAAMRAHITYFCPPIRNTHIPQCSLTVVYCRRCCILVVIIVVFMDVQLNMILHIPCSTYPRFHSPKANNIFSVTCNCNSAAHFTFNYSNTHTHTSARHTGQDSHARILRLISRFVLIAVFRNQNWWTIVLVVINNMV